MKKVSNYRDKMYKEFIAGLTEQQKQVYDQLENLLIYEMSIEGSKQEKLASVLSHLDL